MQSYKIANYYFNPRTRESKQMKNSLTLTYGGILTWTEWKCMQLMLYIKSHLCV